jgi:hypothetical protein
MPWNKTQESEIPKETQVCESLCLHIVQNHVQSFGNSLFVAIKPLRGTVQLSKPLLEFSYHFLPLPLAGGSRLDRLARRWSEPVFDPGCKRELVVRSRKILTAFASLRSKVGSTETRPTIPGSNFSATVSFMQTAELLVHGKAAEVSASALDALLAIELEAMAVEKWPGSKTGVGGNSDGADGPQRGLHAQVKSGADTATDKRGMSVKKVEIAVVCVGSKARENAVRFGDDSVKMSETLLPARDIGRDRRPRRNLFRRIERRCQRANRSGVSFDDVRQVGGLIWSFVHKGARRNAWSFMGPVVQPRKVSPPSTFIGLR